LAIPENDGSAPDACGKHQRIPEFLQLQFADYSLILPGLCDSMIRRAPFQLKTAATGSLPGPAWTISIQKITSPHPS
jgi:hypothetical protein